MREVDDAGGGVEVGVVVHEREAVFRGEYGGEQVGEADGAVPASAGECTLRIESPVPVFVVGGQVLICHPVIGTDLLVLVRASLYIRAASLRRRVSCSAR